MGAGNILCIFTLLILVSIVTAIPLPDCTLYGSVTVNDYLLTKDDSNVISLTVDGEELASFTMGDVDADAYVLKVPINSEETEGFAQTGDTARIYIDGEEVDQSPITIGDFGTTIKLDLSVSSEQPTPSGGTSSSTSGGGSRKSGDREPEVSRESIIIPEPEEISEEQPKIKPKEEDVVISAETPQKQTKEVKEEVEKIGLLQRLRNLFGEKDVTGKAVAEAPKAKPLIGIIIALIIVAVGLTIAYFVIFKREKF